MRTLEHMLPLATRSHNGTSFDPEKRGERIINDYSSELDEDLKIILPGSGYQAKYELKLHAWLLAKCNCISTMIAGPSNFPVRRAEKANQSEDNRYREFRQWREYALKNNAKQIQANKSPEQVNDEKWNSLKKSITGSAATIFAIDNGTNRYSARTLFVNSITGLVKRVAESGDITNVNRMLDYIKELNTCKHATKPIVTDKNAIWDLGEVAEVVREQKFDKANAEREILPFAGGEVIINYAIDRIQIAHESKPGPDVIFKLKKNAFKWSPSNMAWQRQLTNNAIYATMDLTGISIHRI